MRCGFLRMRYRVAPGLYAVGRPDARAPVFVSANYKLSFDLLRRHLGDIAGWILVIETFGINVWCAAGKGSFSAEEIARRVETTGLARIISHRTLILPQLAAPGVAAHRVRELAGFHAIYGPIHARDIRAFLASGMKATPEMRRMPFPFLERAKLIPMEVRFALKVAIPLMAGMGILFLAARGKSALAALPFALVPLFVACLLGSAALPALLPWIPFRSFALKGASLGAIWAIAVNILRHEAALAAIGNLLLFPALAAFFALNFTGSTTYTSQHGVNREIRLFARPIGIAALAGLALTIASYFLS